MLKEFHDSAFAAGRSISALARPWLAIERAVKTVVTGLDKLYGYTTTHVLSGMGWIPTMVAIGTYPIIAHEIRSSSGQGLAVRKERPANSD